MTKLSGGLNNYYVVQVKNPQRKEQEPYQAECEDIIQALGMTFDEGCAFKALWRNAAARMGNGKPGNTAVYDCEKLVHYANRILAKEKVAEVVAPFLNSKPSYDWKDALGVKIEPGIWVETVDNNDLTFTCLMQDAPWWRIKRFRYLEEQPLRTDQGDTELREPVEDKKGDDGWIHSNIKPIITKPYVNVEVYYRSSHYSCAYSNANLVAWNQVVKYRINYS